MATDVVALKHANQELADTVANLQRSLDQIQLQVALLSQALLNASRGHWDAASHGTQSVEAILVAMNPALQGKVLTAPFQRGQ